MGAVVGDGFSKGVQYGPLCNKMQFTKVSELVEDARKNGADIRCSGKAMDGEEIVVDEEQFGPALPVMPYETDEEAIARANSSPYGLGGSVWTKDVNIGNKLATRVLSGTVWVNDHLADTGAPFGGFRESGIGRESGKEDLSTFTEVQTLQLSKL